MRFYEPIEDGVIAIFCQEFLSLRRSFWVVFHWGVEKP